MNMALQGVMTNHPAGHCSRVSRGACPTRAVAGGCRGAPTCLPCPSWHDACMQHVCLSMKQGGGCISQHSTLRLGSQAVSSRGLRGIMACVCQAGCPRAVGCCPAVAQGWQRVMRATWTQPAFRAGWCGTAGCGMPCCATVVEVDAPSRAVQPCVLHVRCAGRAPERLSSSALARLGMGGKQIASGSYHIRTATSQPGCTCTGWSLKTPRSQPRDTHIGLHCKPAADIRTHVTAYPPHPPS
jgi:hypothetical protein